MSITPSSIRPPANYSITLTPTSAAISPIAQQSESPPETTSNRAKRRKIKLACRVCRRRKTRCDGTLPVCQACKSRGVGNTCVYVNIADDPSIKHSETPDRQHHAPRDERIRFSEVTARPQSPASTDALATVAANTMEDGLVYGSSSTIAFVHNFTSGTRNQIQQPELGGRNTSNGNRRSYTDQAIATVPLPMQERHTGSFLLPPRRTANEYVRCFWEFIHPLFPVLHKTSFMEKYSQLWTADDDREDAGDLYDLNEVIFASTLNLIFAIGCQFSHSVLPKNKVSLADDFYQRSRKIYVYDILDSTSVSVVQMLLLGGVYLQSTRYASRCWNIVGLAIRAAQSLGLHLDTSHRSTDSQIDREMRRRIWHTCHVLDKLLAMTFGRPTMIHNNWNVPRPVLVDDEYLLAHGEGAQPPDIPSRLGLLVCSSKLFAILDEVLGAFYSENLRNNLHEALEDQGRIREMLSSVLLLNRRLEEFFSNVPDYIRGAMSSTYAREQNTVVQLQGQVLFCRYQYTRVLLLRPILLLATTRRMMVHQDGSNSSSLDVEFVKSCCNLCVKTAQSLIECLHQHLNTLYRSSGWHSVYFTFAAATILLAGFTCPLVDEDLIRVTFEMNWSRCMAILEHHKQQIPSASRAMRALEGLRAQSLDPPAQEPNIQSPDFEVQEPLAPHIDFSRFDLNGTGFIDDAWFSQDLVNLDWLEPS